jgi:hypothetical protein
MSLVPHFRFSGAARGPGSLSRSGYCGNTGSGRVCPLIAAGAGGSGELIRSSLIATSIRNLAAVAIGITYPSTRPRLQVRNHSSLRRGRFCSTGNNSKTRTFHCDRGLKHRTERSGQIMKRMRWSPGTFSPCAFSVGRAPENCPVSGAVRDHSAAGLNITIDTPSQLSSWTEGGGILPKATAPRLRRSI